MAAVRRAHSSVTRPAAATKAGRRADASPLRKAVSDAARSPASVNAPRPAKVRTADQEASARLTASRPPTPSTASRTAKLRVMRVSRSVSSEGPPSRSGAKANATPIAILMAPKVRTMSLELIRAKEPNVAREDVTLSTQRCRYAGPSGRDLAEVRPEPVQRAANRRSSGA